jgi:hypothetical protein
LSNRETAPLALRGLASVFLRVTGDRRLAGDDTFFDVFFADFFKDFFGPEVFEDFFEEDFDRGLEAFFAVVLDFLLLMPVFFFLSATDNSQ